MWCVNTMAAQSWADTDSQRTQPELPVFSDKEADDDPFEQTKTLPRKNIFRSSSCNRGGPKNSKTKRRSSSSSSFRDDRLSYRSKFRAKNLSLDSTDGEQKELLSPKPTTTVTKRSSFSDNVFVKLARQYSLSRNNRRQTIMPGRKNDPEIEPVDTGHVVFNKRERRRKISTVENAHNTKPTNGVEEINKISTVFANTNTMTPQIEQRGIFRSVSNMTSSDSSCPNSPTFPAPMLTPSITNSDNIVANSPNLSPLPNEEFKDTDRPMSLGSLRGFGGGRPTSMSSVTSSISSRTSRGSDYFSSASSTGDQHQVNPYRMAKDLPVLDESEYGNKIENIDEEDEGVGCDIGDIVSMKSAVRRSPSKKPLSNKNPMDEEAAARKRAVFAAHDQNDINSVDHLAPVSTAAMLANPDLSYVDRVILELLETERMYVRSMRDILSGYLATIRGNTELNIYPNDVDALFGNIRDVYDFNRHLLHELEKCYGDPVQVAQCFVSMNDSFRVYSEYCTHYPSSVSAMTRCMRNPHVARFFRTQQDKMNHTLPLGSYLLKPVQRILKYHLLLQELVKNCDKDVEGYPIIQHALSTMTKIARHINDMKKKHEDAVHIQEIQSLLTCWQGSELTTYGELVLEGEMRMAGAKNPRQVFLFDKLILVTKRNEDGYLVCKIDINCGELMLLESVENNPCAFHILPFHDSRNIVQIPTTNTANKFDKQYTLIAPCVEEKKLWTHHIKRLIIENHHAKIPTNVKQTIMRMKPVRDGETLTEKVKTMPKYGSLSATSMLGMAEAKGNKIPKPKFSRSSSTHQSAGKNRRKSDTLQKKGLHLRVIGGERKSSLPLLPSELGSKLLVHRALKKSNEVDSSDDISSDSVPNTPKNAGGSKFSFPILRGSVQRLSNGHITSSKLSMPKLKTPTNSPPSAKDNTPPTPSTNCPKPEEQNKEEKPNAANAKQDGRVVYRRHKRRTSQPITFVEKRQSRKLTENEVNDVLNDDDENKVETAADMDVDDFFKSPLSPRQSVSWDIQIVDAVFERYKRESSMSVTSNCDDEEIAPPNPSKPEPNIILEPIPDLGSTYLTVPGDVAPSPLLSYKHSSNPMDRRKSRIQVLVSDTSDDEGESTSGKANVVKSANKNVESDGGSKTTSSSQKRKAKAESRRASMVIHDSDTDAETKVMMREKAVSARRKLSMKRRERTARKLAAEKNTNSNNNKKPIAYRQDSVKSIYDNVSDEDVKSTTQNNLSFNNSCLTTETSSVSVSCTQCSTAANVQSTTLISSPANNKQRKQYKQKLQEMREKRNSDAILGKDAAKIKSGKVQGLIEKIKNIEIEHGSLSPPSYMLSPIDNDAKQNIFSFNKPNDELLTSMRPSYKLNNLSTFDSATKNSISTVTTTSTMSSVAFTSSVESPITTDAFVSMKETNLGNRDVEMCNNITSALPVDNRISIVTTESLPLTLTSESSSENSETEELNASSKDSKEERSQGKNTEIFLTRSFSFEDGSKTRKSRNLVLETKPETPNHKTQDELNETPCGAFTSPESKTDSNSLQDAKLFLFEKLCSVKPEFKPTDKLSEDVDHVWSDQEKGIQTTISPTTNDEDIARRNSPAKDTQDTLNPKDKATTQLSNSTNGDVTKAKPNNLSTNRSCSVRSIRSERVSSKYQGPNADLQRGRSFFTRSDRTIPRDAKIIPERSVHKLAEKFNQNTSPSEKVLKPFNIPRRSRSVGHNLGRRKKPQLTTGSPQNDADGKKDVKDSGVRIRQRATYQVINIHKAEVRPPLEKNRISEVQDGDNLDNKTEKISDTGIKQNTQKLTEKSIFESPRNSLNLNKLISVEQSPNSVKVSLIDKPFLKDKKVSLVEMFAANPHENTNVESENEELEKESKKTLPTTPSCNTKPSRYSQLFAKINDESKEVERCQKNAETNESNTFYYGRKRYGSTSECSNSNTKQSSSTNYERTVKRYSVDNSRKTFQLETDSERPTSYVNPTRRSSRSGDRREKNIKRRGIILSESHDVNDDN